MYIQPNNNNNTTQLFFFHFALLLFLLLVLVLVLSNNMRQSASQKIEVNSLCRSALAFSTLHLEVGLAFIE